MSEQNKFTYTRIPTRILSDEWNPKGGEISYYMHGGATEQGHMDMVDLTIKKLMKGSEDHYVEWRLTFKKTHVPRVVAPPFTVVNFRIRDSY